MRYDQNQNQVQECSLQFECCVISVLKERAVSPPLLLQQQLRHGSHQEEDAGHEGGEGQRLRQGRCLRGAVQGCQGKYLFWVLQNFGF